MTIEWTELTKESYATSKKYVPYLFRMDSEFLKFGCFTDDCKIHLDNECDYDIKHLLMHERKVEFVAYDDLLLT